MIRLLLVDNYDSFTYNLSHLFGSLGADVEVIRNDEGLLLNYGVSLELSRSVDDALSKGVPLFFVGYAFLKTRARLRAFFLILLVIATANGIVGMVQLNLTPAQLASWGPGYAFRINGNGSGLCWERPRWRARVHAQLRHVC